MEDIKKSIIDNQNKEKELIGTVLINQDIEKAKAAAIGEVRTYSGVEYKKVSNTGNPNKDWKRVKKGEDKTETVKTQTTGNPVIDSIISMGDSNFKARIEKMQDLIRREIVANKKTKEKEQEFLNKLPEFEKFIKGKGLEITKYSARKSGYTDNPDWQEGDQLSISLVLSPIDNKFKFAVKAYNINNSKKIEKGAQKLSEEIESVTGFSTNVNQYSLEVGEGGVGRVLVEIWVK